MPSSIRSARLRWAAPVVVAAVIGLVAFLPTLSAGAATPKLATISPTDLLVKVQQTNVQSLSGTIRLTTNLGLPNLGGLADAAGRNSSGFNPTDYLSGTHSANVWIDGPDRQKLTMVSTLAETDIIHNGQNVWTWQSAGSKVDHIVLSSHKAAGTTKPEAKPDTAAKAGAMETPAAAAQALLAQINPSTTVSVSTPTMVAGQKAYELVLTPNDKRSTVAKVAIAVDSRTGLPLRVSVFAVNQSKPAFELGFTQLKYRSFKAGDPLFTFTPPKGATVTTSGAGVPNTPKAQQPASTVRKRHRRVAMTAPAPSPAITTSAGKTQTVGSDWTQVVIFSNSGMLPAQANEVLNSAPQVTVGSEQARLVHTALLNVLVLPDGRVAVGAVNEATLEADVASAH